ncbi:hypothetical protein B0T14DRAFT_514381 [Immersiella caudata]|uniref:Uncharacterized protein n=1 Tax=Immersiella caudata TaxID=314043 RepID=A0AA40C2L7_9PEZI|nr:hypothetical protein B0T14DRAFT_514381 [Immersiella caudata]
MARCRTATPNIHPSMEFQLQTSIKPLLIKFHNPNHHHLQVLIPRKGPLHQPQKQQIRRPRSAVLYHA